MSNLIHKLQLLELNRRRSRYMRMYVPLCVCVYLCVSTDWVGSFPVDHPSVSLCCFRVRERERLALGMPSSTFHPGSPACLTERVSTEVNRTPFGVCTTERRAAHSRKVASSAILEWIPPRNVALGDPVKLGWSVRNYTMQQVASSSSS